MSTRSPRLYVIPLLALACLFVGCGPSTPLTEDQAVAAAIDASDMSEPIAIVSTRAGIAEELWDGVRPSWTGTEGRALDDYMKKLRRPAWLVVLDGTYPRGPECRDRPRHGPRAVPPFAAVPTGPAIQWRSANGSGLKRGRRSEETGT